jgi:hypothetical protein
LSQIIKNSTSGGSIPPTVPESFVTDDGTAIPVANVLNIKGGTTTEDNHNGIQTVANPHGSNNLVVELTNRGVGTVTTTDATPTTSFSFPLDATPGLYTFQGYFSGFIPASNAGGSYFFDTSIKTNGTTATEIGTNYTTILEDPAMANSDINVTTSGNNAIFEVIGTAATAINWIVKFEYSKVE